MLLNWPHHLLWARLGTLSSTIRPQLLTIGNRPTLARSPCLPSDPLHHGADLVAHDYLRIIILDYQWWDPPIRISLRITSFPLQHTSSFLPVSILLVSYPQTFLTVSSRRFLYSSRQHQGLPSCGSARLCRLTMLFSPLTHSRSWRALQLEWKMSKFINNIYFLRLFILEISV